jgi:nitrogen-specific signal transduction histidine kinase
MQKTRYIPVYPKQGKVHPQVRKAQGGCGAYIIKKGSQILYVGHSANQLYKTITRHFQSWGANQTRVTYPQSSDYKVRIIKTTCAKAKKLEQVILAKYQPKDNPRKVDEQQVTRGMENAYEEMQGVEARKDVPF